MSAGLAVPITTSGRPSTCAHPSWVTAKAARLHAMTTGRAQDQALGILLCSERIFDGLSLQFDQGFNPALVPVVEHAADVMGRDHLIAAGAHRSLWRVDLLAAKQFCDQPDLSAVLGVDQPLLMHDAAIPKRIRGQKVRGREERTVLADDAKAVRGSVAGNLQARAVAVRRARGRYQAAR